PGGAPVVGSAAGGAPGVGAAAGGGGGVPGVGAAVTAEIALLALATAFAAALEPHAGDDAALLTIAPLAAAMGLRTTIVRRRGAPNLASTVLNLTAIGGAAGGLLSGDDAAQRAAALAVLLAGAVVGALLLQAALWLPLALATALTLATHLVDRREPAPAA
ncbi:DUF1275 family protein, partial [Conexibacter sp. JD483]|uniref:DUF1275 family protein n=3 Tax=Conexibacter TaxID=191494 RepID=UPI0028705C38